MNKDYIADALSEINDDFIIEAASILEANNINERSKTNTPKNKSFSFLHRHRTPLRLGAIFAIAAIITLLLINRNMIVLPFFANRTDYSEDGAVPPHSTPGSTATTHPSEEGVYIPQAKLSLVERDDVCYSWVAPIAIYNGRSYIRLGIVDDVDDSLLGEHLGTCTGLLKEWSDPYEYVDFSGNIEGELYAIKGYDTDFMIGLKTSFEDSSDVISALINGNDITLTTGADIFEKRLHLAGNYDKVTYQSREDWYESNGNIKTFDKASSDILSDFVNSLNKGKVMLTDEIPLEDKDSSIFDEKELCHLVFYKKDGIAIELRCMEGGYVFFDGIRQVCVKMSEESFNQVCYAFDKSNTP